MTVHKKADQVSDRLICLPVMGNDLNRGGSRCTLATATSTTYRTNHSMTQPKHKPADYLFWAVKQQTGNTTRNLILIYLADFMGKDGCFPSYLTISNRAGCSRRSTINHVKFLESSGYLKRQKRALNGMSSSNKYILNLDKSGVQEVHYPSAAVALPSAGGSLGVVQQLHPETPTTKHPTKHPVKHTPITPSKFDQFYLAYPKKVGRSKALIAWDKLNPSPALINRILIDIVDRVELGAWCTGKGKQYIPGPAPYLNQCRWEDEIIPQPDFKPTPEQLAVKTQQMINQMDEDGSWTQ